MYNFFLAKIIKFSEYLKELLNYFFIKQIFLKIKIRIYMFKNMCSVMLKLFKTL